MDDIIRMLTYALNMAEECLKNDDNPTVKLGVLIFATDALMRAVRARAVPVGCAEIILSNWEQRLAGHWEMTCHAVTTLEARDQFNARPKRKKPPAHIALFN